MSRFRKLPVEIEAVQYNGANMDELWDWGGAEHIFGPAPGLREHGYIETLEGDMEFRPGDWIIKGIKGEFYPCKPDIFEQTYESVEEAEHGE